MGPKINMENIKGTAEGPGKDQLAIASNGAIGGDTVGTLQHPSGNNVLAAKRPEETKTNAL
jgi:hypothetical protein